MMGPLDFFFFLLSSKEDEVKQSRCIKAGDENNSFSHPHTMGRDLGAGAALKLRPWAVLLIIDKH